MGASNNTKRRLQSSLILAALGGIFGLGWLFMIPTENGLSPIRIGMIFLLGLGILLPLFGLTAKKLNKLSSHLRSLYNNAVTNRRWIFGLSIIALNCIYLLLLAPEAQDIVAQAMLTRLSPLFFYFTVLSILGIWLLIPAQLPSIRYSVSRQVFLLTLSIFGGLLLGWGLIWITKWGLTPEIVGFNAMGIPILEVYVFLAWALTLLVGKAIRIWHQKYPQSQPSWRFDALLIISLYLLTALFWRSTPAPFNWFVTQPYPPNQQPYPSSDALRYDTTGQSMLIGEGLKTDNSLRTLRPLYTGILGILHAVGGPDYQPVMDLQPFVLAIFPVMLYLLGSQMHSRMAGLFVALLIIFREQTAIELSDRITISHAKLAMADLPTAVALCGFILLAVIWLKAERPRWQMALFSGGALGASMLIRSESLLFVAVVGFISFLNWRRNLSTWIGQLVIFGLGILLVTAPWMYRNWQRYDMVFFDDPSGRLTAVIGRAVAVPPAAPDEPTQTTPTLPNQTTETTQQAIPATKLPESTSTNNTFDQAATIISNRPQAVLVSIVNHYLNSEIQSVLALPTTFRLPDSLINFLYHKDIDLLWRSCCQAISYYERMPYWQSWGKLPSQAILPLIGNLFLISSGIALAYRRLKWAGLFPLLAHAAFLAGIALFRTSGGRYILPVNWILVVYFALGVVALTIWVGKLLGWMSDLRGWNTKLQLNGSVIDRLSGKNWVGILVPVVGLFILGCTLPILESAFPQRISTDTHHLMWQAVTQTLSQTENEQINNWLANNNFVFSGRALYPRFLEAGNGEIDKEPTVMARTYDRLTFFLIGPSNMRVHFPISNLENGFPNGSDVVVIGCRYMDDKREVIDAQLVVRVDIDGNVQEILWRNAEPSSECTP